MTEPSHDLDDGYVYLHNEHDNIEEQTGITQTSLLEGDASGVPRRLLYLLILTCGGAGYFEALLNRRAFIY